MMLRYRNPSLGFVRDTRSSPRPMPPRIPRGGGLIPRRRLGGLFLLLLLLAGSLPVGAGPLRLPGLQGPAWIAWDHHGIPHITAAVDLDTSFLLGYVHARDRFFQMDSLRRQFSGTLAELLGPAALPADVQFRTFGLRRAAEATWPELSPESQAWLIAYSAGVNAFLTTQAPPPEYTLLELSGASIAPWDVLDSLTLGKGLLASFSLDFSDLQRTRLLAAYQAAGNTLGFDGEALLFEDLDRFEPFHSTVTVPDGGTEESLTGSATSPASGAGLSGYRPEALELAAAYVGRLEAVPSLRGYLEQGRSDRGSNWWLISGDHTDTGEALIASDPHRGLTSPAGPYEVHLKTLYRSRGRSLDATGLSFPGVPALVQGCTRTVCWASSFHAADHTDIYQEELVLDPATGLPAATLFQGAAEPLEVLPQSFRTNRIGDGVLDNSEPAPVPPTAGGLTFVVPRRNRGPIIAVDTSAFPRIVGLSVQYTGWRATQEVECFRQLLRARDVDDVERALQSFDAAQNWAAADSSGGIAYWVSGELPLREDLQTQGAPDGVPPFLLRDGTGARRHEWLSLEVPAPGQSLPYQVLPFSELPKARDPETGYLLNANNDPDGGTLDNDPLNRQRPGGGVHYVGFSYSSLRAGRLEEILGDSLSSGGEVGLGDLQRWQADDHLFDAQLFVPYILEAFDNAAAPGTPPSLATLAADPRVSEAVERLRTWDFSTPTGIREGFDPGDSPEALPEPTAGEIDASVAATLYAMWRGRMLANTVDGALDGVGLGSFKTIDLAAWQGVFHLLRSFADTQGVGASGLRLIPLAPDSPESVHGRDQIILKSLREGLDLLASEAFAPAFGGSTEQGDYRWGRLHRITFSHPLGSPFSIPEGGGFSHLSEELRGIPRSGGLSTVDAASHLIIGRNSDGFLFRTGPDNRFVARLGHRGVQGLQVIAGGQSADPASPFQADQLHLWLTNQYRQVLVGPREILEHLHQLQFFLPE